MGVIYSYRNTITDKRYIGQTIHEEERKRQHRRLSKSESDNECKKFYRSVRKYGWDVFEYEVLEECDDDSLNEKEMFYIERYDSYNNGYNCSLGGGSSLGRNLSEETKKKISEKRLSMNLTYTHSEEAKQKMREKRSLQVFSEEDRKKMSESAKNRPPISEETRKKMSEQRKGRKHSEETKEKIRQKALGRKHTQQTKEKLSTIYKERLDKSNKPS